MTSLIAWIGVDSRGPASMYLASDSRISWEPRNHWDAGRKLFASAVSPDLLGYCGDVVFPSLFLGQVADLLSLEAFVDVPPADRHDAVVRLAQDSFLGYPTSQQRAFSILHGARESSGMRTRFHLWRIDWEPASGWRDAEVALPTESVLVLAAGSGSATVAHYDDSWRRTSVARTSRAVYSAFCDSVRSGDDPHSGGATQLVGLYREGSAETFGTIYNGGRFLLGLPVKEREAAALSVEWRNELFERCDGVSMMPLRGAQRHSRPRQLELPRTDSTEDR